MGVVADLTLLSLVVACQSTPVVESRRPQRGIVPLVIPTGVLSFVLVGRDPLYAVPMDQRDGHDNSVALELTPNGPEFEKTLDELADDRRRTGEVCYVFEADPTAGTINLASPNVHQGETSIISGTIWRGWPEHGTKVAARTSFAVRREVPLNLERRPSAALFGDDKQLFAFSTGADRFPLIVPIRVRSQELADVEAKELTNGAVVMADETRLFAPPFAKETSAAAVQGDLELARGRAHIQIEALGPPCLKSD